MRSYLTPVVMTFLFTPACADRGEPESKEDSQSISGTLETMSLDESIVRGFLAGGTGCFTAADPVIQDDSITFMLMDYIAAKRGAGIFRATCNPAVEIALPAGVTIALGDVVYRGFAEGAASRSTFSREYFFPGAVPGDRRFTIVDYDAAGVNTVARDDSDEYGSEFGDFTARDSVRSDGSSPCGESAIWRADTSLQVRNATAASFAYVAFDSIDVEHTVTFRFRPPTSCL